MGICSKQKDYYLEKFWNVNHKCSCAQGYLIRPWRIICQLIRTIQ